MMDKSLLTSIADPKFLREAWNKLNTSNKESHGISEETIKEFGDHIEQHIRTISQLLLARRYIPSKVKGVLIPKKSKGEFRPLRIPEVRDRLVAKAISLKLDQLLTPIFKLDNSCSFAYRKEKNVELAIKSMVEYYKAGHIYILEADIIKFFDKVNRDILLDKVFPNLEDDSINNLIELFLSQEVGNLDNHKGNTHYFLNSSSGIPQGSSLSPLLANIYLAEFDQRMLTENYKMIRYADDFTVMTASEEDARKAFQIAKEELEYKLKLSLYPLATQLNLKDKTSKIVDPTRHKFSFLSIRFDGKALWVSDEKITSLREKIRLIADVEVNPNLLKLLTRMKNLLEGWVSAFKFVDIERDIKEIDDYVDQKLLHIFRRFGFEIKKDK